MKCLTARARLRGWFLFAALCSCSGTLFAAQEDPATALKPPKGELPPGFWEQAGWMVAVGLIVIVGGVITWAFLRSGRKPPIIPPPAVTARRALEILRNQADNQARVTEVSKIFRKYIVSVLVLPAGEYTTLDIIKVMQSLTLMPLDLKQDIAGFLQQCDEQKFSPMPVHKESDVIGRASELVDKTENAIMASRRQAMPETVIAPAK
jgi:hypothetical protein